jgi:hypothetical protein
MITLRGSVKYDDRVDPGGQPPRLNAQYIKVDAWDNNGAVNPCEAPDRKLGTAYTDANGNWSIPNICNSDTSGDGSRIDLYVKFYASTEDSPNGPRHRVRSPDALADTVYWWQTKPSTWWDIPDSGSYQATVSANVVNQQAMWLLSDANRAWSYIKGRVEAAVNDPGPLYLFWAPGWTSWSPGCTSVGISCFVWTPLSPNYWGEFIADPDPVRSPDTVVHEIAHAYVYNASGRSGSSCPSNQNHTIFGPSNPQCAWEEGWADFFPLQVNGGRCYDFRTVGDCTDQYVDLEAPTWGDGKPYGDSVEGRVAGALLDMHDTAPDGLDTVSYGFHRTWNIIDAISNPPPEFTAGDFYDHWNSYGTYRTDSPIAACFC